LNFNAPVTVSGVPQVTLGVGSPGNLSFRNAKYVAGSGTAALTFGYTVANGDEDADGVQVMAFEANGGAVRETSGLEASPALPLRYFSSGITIAPPLAPVGAASASVPSATPAGLVNVSSRGVVQAGDGAMIVGFAVSGSARRLLVRGIGPGLAAYGVNGALADPVVKIYQGERLVAENDDWSGAAATSTAAQATGAFALSATSKDAALVLTLEPGGYTVVVSGANQGSGVALVEVYEVL
jgi:hypothetical protein